MTMDVENARREWEDAYRGLERVSGGTSEAERLWQQLEVVSAELRRRIGARYTLQDLAQVYRTSDVWARDVVSQQAATPGWPRTLSLVEGAAFHMYSRGAEDYQP